MKNKLNLVKKFVYFGAYIFILALVILMSSAAGLLPGKIKIYTVMSGSMEPTIKTGSVVATKAQSSYSVGDIITFYSDQMDQITTHRISEVVKSDIGIFYKTKGDANDSEDSGMIVGENILGKKIITLPLIGSLISFVRSKIGFVIFMLVPAILIIIDEFRKIILEIKNIKSNRNDNSNLIRLSVVILWILLIPRLSGQNLSHAYYKSQTELTSNIVTDIQNLDFYFNSDKTAVGFKLAGIKKFQLLEYQLIFRHNGVEEMVSAKLDLKGEDEFTEKWIILGTCSEGGVCTNYQNIAGLKLKIKLTSIDTGITVLEKTL